MDVFSIGLQLAFAAVFVVVLQRYLRDRRPVHRDLLFVAGSVVGWFALSTLNTLVPAVGTSDDRMSPNNNINQPVQTHPYDPHNDPEQPNHEQTAQPSRNMLNASVTAVKTLGQSRVKPSLYFRPTAQATSNRPATNRITHAITHLWR